MVNLIKKIKNVLRPVKKKLEKFLPRNFKVSPPVAQLFLGGAYQSRYTLINFPSLFSPKTAYRCKYDVSLYDERGCCIEKKTIKIQLFGSFELVPAEIFTKKLPDIGMLTVRIRSLFPILFADRHLGKLTSHIYTLFINDSARSLVLVHPQTTVSKICADKIHWESDVLWDAEDIKKVTAFQINPTPYPIRSKLFLVNKNIQSNNVVGEQTDVIAPMGCRMVNWDLEHLGIITGKFTLGAQGFSTHNAKPIVLTSFGDGTFTGMHS